MKLAAIFISVTMSFLLSLINLPQASAVCCHVIGVCGLCEDCFIPLPYCGRGSCNFFGCNCDHGCRTGRCKGCIDTIVDIYSSALRGKRAALATDMDVDSTTGEQVDMYKNVSQIIQSADRNSDGKLDFVETVHFFKLEHTAELEEIEIERVFKELDKNGDHFLSDSEIDSI